MFIVCCSILLNTEIYSGQPMEQLQVMSLVKNLRKPFDFSRR